MNVITTHDIKLEARERLSTNLFQAIIIYGLIFTVAVNFFVLAALTILLMQNINIIFSIVFIVYACILVVVFFALLPLVKFAMIDYYLISYRAQLIESHKLFSAIAHGNPSRALKLNLIRAFLGFFLLLLLIVPGIIFLTRTSMAYHLLRANPKMKAWQSVKASNKIMMGHSVAFFSLTLSFYFWLIASILTFGIALIWYLAYYNMSKTVFYKRVLQGDKASYPAQPPPAAVKPAKPAPVEEEEDDEEDEKNVAAKLMKVQLVEEIRALDSQMKSKYISRSKPIEALALNTFSKPVPYPVSRLKNTIPKTAVDNFESENGKLEGNVIVSDTPVAKDGEVPEVALPFSQPQAVKNERLSFPKNTDIDFNEGLVEKIEYTPDEENSELDGTVIDDISLLTAAAEKKASDERRITNETITRDKIPHSRTVETPRTSASPVRTTRASELPRTSETGTATRTARVRPSQSSTPRATTVRERNRPPKE